MAMNFDAAKDRENTRKHGLSLEEAEHFDMTTAFVELDDREDYGEIRFNAIGFLRTSLHVLCFTVRDEELRPISLRKATKTEQKLYAQNT